jgi:hypothetical protein
VACRYTTPIRGEHREPPRILTEYLTSGDFVEAALENWDSEFLQMGMYVVLTAYLFQRGSSESKPIATRRQPAAERRSHREGLAALSAFGVLSSLRPAVRPGSIAPSPATHRSPSPHTSRYSTFNSAGARMCQASVTSSRSRVMSMASSRTITSGDQS